MTHGTVKDTMKTMRENAPGTDDILAALGLERRRGAWGYVLPAVGYFAAGLAVGAGVSLLMAPKPGRQMRRELGDRVRHVGAQLGIGSEHEGQDNGRNRSEESPVRRTTSVSPPPKS